MYIPSFTQYFLPILFVHLVAHIYNWTNFLKVQLQDKFLHVQLKLVNNATVFIDLIYRKLFIQRLKSQTVIYPCHVTISKTTMESWKKSNLHT